MLMLAAASGHGSALPNFPTAGYLPRPRVLALAGKAGAGKSEAARYLIERHGYQRGKFARALKEMTRAYLRYRGLDEFTIERMIEGNLKELPSSHLEGQSPRYWMQKLGTEFGRDQIGKDLWVNTEMAHIAGWSKVVFDDARFPNEVAAIRNVGGMLIEIRRPGHVAANIDTTHESEAHTFTPNYFVINDGTIADLHFKLDQVA